MEHNNFCTTKVLEEYGLWRSYQDRPLLFNLLSRAHAAIFMDEQGFEDIPKERRIVAFEEPEEKSLEICSQLLSKDLSLSPEEMYEKYEKEAPGCLLAYYGGRVELLQGTMYLRILQLKRWRRGLYSVNYRVYKVQFNSLLAPEEDLRLDRAIAQMRSAWLEPVK